MVRKPLEKGSLDDAYPENVQGDSAFNVGGVDRLLPDELQLEQIYAYMEATYPCDGAPTDTYLALLPDRLTHAAMLMLGSAADHAMPGVAFPGGVGVTETEWGALFTPTEPTGAWAVSCAPALGPKAREHAWRPEVAGAAELSGARILDVDTPSDAPAAVAYARERGATRVALWGLGALPEATADATVLTFPANGGSADYVQHRADYFTRGVISTPEQARRRVRDVADFLRRGA
nr:alpha/beta hydrolase [Corynebacterium timonense]